MRRTIASFRAALAAAIGQVPSRGGVGAEATPEARTSAADVEISVPAGGSSGSNAFAVDLYKSLCNRPGNLTLSPASVELVLTLAFIGARGTTADEMARVLHLSPAPKLALTRARELMACLDDSARATLTLCAATRVFVEQSYALERPYLESVSYLREPLEAVDFRGSSERARVRMNEWVAEQTAHCIRDLVPPGGIDDETRLALVNAIYLQADWSEAFAPEATRPRAFHLTASACREVATMHQVSYFPFAAMDGVGLLELPYVGDELSMVILLPDRVDGLPDLETGLDAARVCAWLAALRVERVSVALPRFTVDPVNPLTLAAPLQGLGMKQAFDRMQADFTGLANPPDRDDRLFIGSVFHKAFVRVDEMGTEAAAATGSMMMRMGAALHQQPPKKFDADHPFLFVIRDRKTGAFLFLGRVADPAAA